MRRHIQTSGARTGLISLGRASCQTRGEAPFPAPDAGQTQMRHQLGLTRE
jgi:hypothetical protein